LFTANNFVIKAEMLSFGEMLTVRSVIQILLMLLILKMKGGNVWPRSAYHLVMLCLIGLFGSLTMLTSFISVRLMPVPDAITLMFTAPLFTMVLSSMFLKDRVTLIKAISGLVLMAGIVLVTQPSFLFHDNSKIFRNANDKENETKHWMQMMKKI